MLLTLKPVRDQVIVLFGANSGIGRAAALRFAQRGARVVVSGRSAEPLEELVKEIREAGGRTVFVAAEVTHPEQVKRAAETAVELFDHAQGLDRIRGEFGGRRTSVYTSLATNRAAQGLLAGFGIGAASFLAARTLLRSR